MLAYPKQNSRRSWFLRGRRFIYSLVFMASMMSLSTTVSAQPSKSKSTSSLGRDYAEALAAADHFLQAWQSSDMENGMALLTARAKQTVSRENLTKLFANAEPAAYEITRGKLVKRGRYEFPVVLVDRSQTTHIRRRFSSMVLVETGNNDWAVDKLP
jgi:hypothetical protein